MVQAAVQITAFYFIFFRQIQQTFYFILMSGIVIDLRHLFIRIGIAWKIFDASSAAAHHPRAIPKPGISLQHKYPCKIYPEFIQKDFRQINAFLIFLLFQKYLRHFHQQFRIVFRLLFDLFIFLLRLIKIFRKSPSHHMIS